MAFRLAALMSEIPIEQIQQGIIDDHMVNFGNVTTSDGAKASVLLPIPDKIRELRDKIFTTGGPTSPIAQGDPTALMQADGARRAGHEQLLHGQPGSAHRQLPAFAGHAGDGTRDADRRI